MKSCFTDLKFVHKWKIYNKPFRKIFSFSQIWKEKIIQKINDIDDLDLISYDLNDGFIYSYILTKIVKKNGKKIWLNDFEVCWKVKNCIPMQYWKIFSLAIFGKKVKQDIQKYHNIDYLRLIMILMLTSLRVICFYSV